MARNVGLLALMLLLTGCANTAIGRAVQQKAYQFERQVAAHRGFDVPEDPQAASCTAEKLVGQSYQKVVGCWGNPKSYEIGTRGDGYVLYQLPRIGDIGGGGGLKVLLKEWVVVDVIKQF